MNIYSGDEIRHVCGLVRATWRCILIVLSERNIPQLIPGPILIVEISKTSIFAFYCKKKGEKIWRPQIEILVKSPHGDHVKKLISDPGIWNPELESELELTF